MTYAADIKVSPSATRVSPGENFYIDINVENIPSEGLGAVQFRLNVAAQGSTVAGISDISQGKTTDISVSTPLLTGLPAATRSGMGDFFWNAAGPNGILVMDNETLNNGSGLYTFGHTNGSTPPSGSGSVARFHFAVGKDVAAERIVVTLSDVMLLDTGVMYPLDTNTGASIELRCITKVPNLLGLSKNEALTALQGAGLLAGNIYEIDNQNKSYSLNQALIQSQAAGTSVLCETSVDFAINTAPSEVTGANAADKPNDEVGGIIPSWVPSASLDTAGYRVYLGSQLLSEIRNPSSTGTEISGLPIGQVSQLKITAFDTFGNESSGVIVSATAIDDVAPRITIDGVVEGAFYSGSVFPSITVFDSNLSTKEILLNGISYAMAAIGVEGNYTIKVTAADLSGNITTNEIHFIIDKTPPVISVSGVEKDRYYNVDITPVITVTDSNLGSVESTLNGSLYGSGTVISAEGAYELKVEAQDKAGNKSSDTYIFYIDKTKPISGISIGAPKFENNGSIFVTGSTLFTLAANDEGIISSGVSKIEYRVNGGDWSAYGSPFDLSGVADGTVTVDYRASDIAGNIEDYHTLALKADNTPPDTSLDIGMPKFTGADGTIYIGQQSNISLSASDALSGVAITEYRVDGGLWITYSPFTITAEGSHLIEFRSADNLGNQEAAKTLQVIVDNTPPVTEISVGDPKHTSSEGTFYVTGGTTFMLSATDNLSGVAKTEYRIDGGAWTMYSLFTVPVEGIHAVEYRSTDNVGNLEATGTLSITADNTPPVTTISVSDPKYTAANGTLYVTGNTILTLNATDNLSGVAKTEYRIDSGEWTLYVAFTIPSEGTHTVEYRSADNVGNLEIAKTLSVIIDNTPPVTTISVGDPKYAAADGMFYITGNTLFTLSATDNLSDVAVTEYRIDGEAWITYAPFNIPAEGAHIIEYRSIDNVGNTETEVAVTVISDNTPPATAITVGYPKYTTAGTLYITGNTTFTLSATDNLSGVDRTEYRIDSGAWTLYSAFSIPSEGSHVIEYRSVDNVGNLEGAKTLAVIVDNTPPVTEHSIGDPKYASPAGAMYITKDTVFTLSATDNLSGVAKTEYRIDGGAWTIYSAFSIPAEGSHAIDYRSADNVGNTEAIKSFTVIVDNTSPVTEISIGDPKYQADGNLYIAGKTGISLSSSDALSGVAKTEYKIDGGAFTTYTAPFTFGSYADGAHIITYRSIDNIGNTEQAKSLTIVLDKTPPTTTISASDPLIEGVINTVSPKTRFTLSATDNLSGVKEISYKIDSGSWQTYMANFSLSGMEAGLHTIIYKAMDNVLNEETEKSITVRLIVIDVQKALSSDAVVLAGVWTNENGSDAEQKQADIVNLNSILSALGLNYYIAPSNEEFSEAVRSGRYNTYLLVDYKEPLLGEEIREAVYYGSGLVFIKTNPQADPFLDDAFGVKFTGKTTSSDLAINLVESPISAQGAIQSSGKGVVSTITSNTAQSFGYVADKRDTFNSIIANQYGRGKTILYNFDLLYTTDHSLLTDLISNSLNYVKPAEHYPTALDSILVKISVNNSTEPVDIKLIETIPAGTTVDAILPNASANGNAITWRKYLNANEKTKFSYYLNLPDAAGDFTTNTEVQYDNNGYYRLYGNYSLTLSIQSNSTGLTQGIISELGSITTTNTADADRITKAVSDLSAISVNASNRKDAEQNLRLITNAIDEVRKLSFDTSEIRLKLDELLKIWEKKWYLMEE